MKFFWPILLICIVLGNSLQDKATLNKIGKVYVFLKNLYELRDKNRKLQENTDGVSDEGEVTANSSAFNMTESEAKAPMNKTTGKTDLPYQIKGFYGFTQKAADNFFKFHMFFSFWQKVIAAYIRMRLRISYATRRLRNLEEETAQSVPCSCDISSGFTAGTPGTGENIDYDCKAEKLPGKNVTNVNLDTTVPMQIGDEEVSFENINFDEEAAEQASNIASATKKGGIIKVTEFSDTFTITGTPLPEAFLELNQVVNIYFTLESSDSSTSSIKKSSNHRRMQSKTYPCTVLSSSSSETKLQCEGYEDDLSVEKVNSAKSDDENVDLTFSVPDDGSVKIPSSASSSSGSGPVYRKSSSGLSGGAIAGIVIACVVVLIAAAVAAIMLRKPTPPVDNTTVVDLKQENI